ncbi:hypothetical protein AOQ84DRAFT_199956 [Glonium stellatum]|uniref:Uncharacterized protein n=1 Tax=Glonium stellatum TaxID=574774 RepID=A0A8E2EPF3_9PEZI|nr:hypothetical protein AOQ84DRAFT_199956 [Glonium stellatum]
MVVLLDCLPQTRLAPSSLFSRTLPPMSPHFLVHLSAYCLVYPSIYPLCLSFYVATRSYIALSSFLSCFSPHFKSLLIPLIPPFPFLPLF